MGRKELPTTGAEKLQEPTPDKRQAEDFADFLRSRRNELGLSLRQLSRLTGIDHTNLFRWENNRRRPETLDVLTPLAQGLDVPLADLCARAGHDLTRSLPHLTPYLHLKYGRHLPPEVLCELVAHCETVLAHHGAQHAAEPAAARGG